MKRAELTWFQRGILNEIQKYCVLCTGYDIYYPFDFWDISRQEIDVWNNQINFITQTKIKPLPQGQNVAIWKISFNLKGECKVKLEEVYYNKCVEYVEQDDYNLYYNYRDFQNISSNNKNLK